MKNTMLLDDQLFVVLTAQDLQTCFGGDAGVVNVFGTEDFIIA